MRRSPRLHWRHQDSVRLRLMCVPMEVHYHFLNSTNGCRFLSAYSAGIGTFCYIITNVLGSGIIRWSGMRTVGEDCNFDDLPHLIVVYQILLPLVVGIPATLFIPNLLQTEQLIEWEKESWYEDETHDQDQTLGSEDDTNSDGQVLLRANSLL